MINISYSSLKRDIRLGVKNLLLHKLRSILTMLGLVFGVGSVIAMLAIGEGASEEALARIRSLGSKNIIITSKKPISEGAMMNNNIRLSVYGLFYNDSVSIQETIPTVSKVVPVKAMEKDARFNNRSAVLRVVGTSADWFSLVNRERLAGRVLNPSDIAYSKSVAVLTEKGARTLLANEGVVGEILRIGGNSYEVIGVIRHEEASDSGMQMPDRDADVYIPITTSRLHYGDIYTQNKAGSRSSELVELHQIIVEVSEEKYVERTAETIQRILDISHKKKNDYDVSVPLSLLRQAEATKRTFSIVLGAIAGISLLVGGIGIMNIMLVSVTERTREIGIRKSLGAKGRVIMSQFVIEAGTISGIGGVIGIIVGSVVAMLGGKMLGLTTVPSIGAILIAFGVSVGIGIIFGYLPAKKAAKLNPIDALRYD